MSFPIGYYSMSGERNDFFPSCNQAICISWKGRIGCPTMETDRKGGFFLALWRG